MALFPSVILRVRGPRCRRVNPADEARRRALADLHARRSAVNDLIGALEQYQQDRIRLRASAPPGLTDEEMSS